MHILPFVFNLVTKSFLLQCWRCHFITAQKQQVVGCSVVVAQELKMSGTLYLKKKKSSLMWDTFSFPYLCLSQIHHQTLIYLVDPEEMSEQMSFID